MIFITVFVPKTVSNSKVSERVSKFSGKSCFFLNSNNFLKLHIFSLLYKHIFSFWLLSPIKELLFEKKYKNSFGTERVRRYF